MEDNRTAFDAAKIADAIVAEYTKDLEDLEKMRSRFEGVALLSVKAMNYCEAESEEFYRFGCMALISHSVAETIPDKPFTPATFRNMYEILLNSDDKKDFRELFDKFQNGDLFIYYDAGAKYEQGKENDDDEQN